MAQGKKDADVKKLLPTLDIGSHSNASLQVRLEAGAERTLEAVTCKPMFGGWFSPQSGTMIWRVEPP
jgi:hypothetical protein